MSQGDRPRQYSLRWLLTAWLTVLLIGVLVAGTYLSASRFTEYLSDQLRLQTADAALALGVSLSSVASDGQAERIIDAIFESGSYRSIEWRGPNGDLLYRRSLEASKAQVPTWFRHWASLPEPQGRAAVVTEWQPSGDVLVTGNPAPALQDLWASFRLDLLFMAGILILALAVLWWVMVRMLRPLGNVEQQAVALEAGDFNARTSEPGVRELTPVVRAMNRMAEQLQQTFSRQVKLIEALQREVSQDSVTGMNNRDAFEQQLNALLYSREEGARGVLAIVRLKAFGDLNQAKGRPAANRLLAECAERVRRFEGARAGVISGRGNGAEILLFLPHAAQADGEQWLGELVHELSELYSAHAVPASGVVQAGATIADPTLRIGEIMARSDRALQSAEAGDEPVVQWSESLTQTAADTTDWRAALDDALAAEDLALLWQPIFDGEQKPRMDQALARLKVRGEWMNAVHFMPYLERFGLTPALDRMVLDAVLARLEAHGEWQASVVLGQSSLADDGFLHWLGLRLERASAVAGRLWLAIPERVLGTMPQVMEELEEASGQTGVRLLIDQFGTGGLSFDYLARVRAGGVRISQHYVRDVHQRADARFFLESMVPLIQQQGMSVFVSGVEVADEWEVIKTLGVDGVMGFHFSRPHNEPSVERGD